MHSAKNRLDLIGNIERMRDVSCSLRVIDTTITLDERIGAWKRHGGTEQESEGLRCRAALHLRAPKASDIEPREVLALDLDDMGLQRVELQEFSSLQTLRLRNNALTALGGRSVLPPLTVSGPPTSGPAPDHSAFWNQLKVLDLRNNQISNLAEVVAMVNSLQVPFLLSLSALSCC
jgi:hypothetical protein